MIKGRGRGRGIVNKLIHDNANGSLGHNNHSHSHSAQSELQRRSTTECDELQGVKPSHSDHSKTVTLDDVAKCINNLGIDASEQDLENLLITSCKYATNADMLKQIASLLYKRSLSDPDFSQSMAKATAKLCLLEVDGSKFRKIILTLMQSDFKMKEELRTTSEDKFMAFLSFLCQMFLHVKTEHNEPFNVLLEPIVQCMTMIIIDGSDHEIECCAQQLRRVGAQLQNLKPNALESLFNKVRRRVISQRSTPCVRRILLELVEMKANKWQPLPLEIGQFYIELATKDSDNS